MADFNKCKILKDANGSPTGVIISARAKMVWGDLFTATLPKGEKNPDKARFQITCLFPKESDLAVMNDRVKEVIAENVSAAVLAKTKVKKPFLKVNAEEQPKIVAMLKAVGLKAEDFPTMVRCNAKFKPTVLAPNMTPVNDEEEVYNGRWCRVSINFYFYDHPTGGKGVSAGLNNVQLLENDEPLPRSGGGGNANAEFEAVEVSAGSGSDSVFDD